MDSLNNVTMRKPKLIKSSSHEEISYNCSLDSSLSIDLMGRSVELTSHTGNLEEMQSQITNLRTNLQTTQNELENVILENVDLKKQLEKLAKEVGALKQICRSPVTSLRRNLSSTSKKSAKRRLTDSFKISPLELQLRGNLNIPGEEENVLGSEPGPQHLQEPEIRLNEVSQENQEVQWGRSEPISYCLHDTIQESAIDTRLENEPPLEESRVIPTCSTLLEKNLNSTNAKNHDRRHKILFLSDDTGRGVGKRLQRLVGPEYAVTSVIKSGAMFEQVVNSCPNYCKDFTTADFVILMAGSNDSNPLSVQSYLYHTLNELKKTNVFVCKTYRNKKLNVNHLNYMMRHVCRNCTNSEYVEFDDEDSFIGFNKLNASRLLYRAFLRVNQRNKYNNYIRTVSKVTDVSKKTTSDKWSQTDMIISGENVRSTACQTGVSTGNLEQAQNENENATFFRGLLQ